MSGLKDRWLNHLVFVLCLLSVNLSWLASLSANDAPDPGRIQSVSFGFDGLMKPGSWCRVRTTLSGADTYRVEVVTPDPAGHPVVYSSVAVDPQVQDTADVYVKSGRLQTSMTVRVVTDSDNTVADSQRFVSIGTPGAVGDFRIVRHSTPTCLFCGGFSGSADVSAGESETGNPGTGATLLSALEESGVAISRASVTELPTDWRALAAFRTVVLSREFDLSDEQSAALAQWVGQGGHLIVVTGMGARAMAARSPAEIATAILDVLDASGARSLRVQTLAELCESLETASIDSFSDAGAADMLDKSIETLPEVLAQLKLEPAKSRQLRDAFRSMHRELLGVTQEKVNATLSDGALGEWVLGDATLTATTLSDLTGLETLISSSWSIPVSGRHWGAVIADDDGKTLADGIEGVLLSRRSYGCGRVSVCGVALDQSPVSRWKEANTFLLAMIDQPVDRDDNTTDRRRISRSGITELGTQLFAAVESIPQVEERNTLGVLGLTLLYLLLIGPLDYYLVHHLLKKPQLTWGTFPLAVVLACLLGSVSASSRNSGTVETQRLEILDVDTSSQFTRTTTLSTVFSPQHARYELAVPHATVSSVDETGASAVAAHVSWFGFPETNYGGMYRSAGGETGRPPYRMTADGRKFENLPIPIWSDRVVVSESLGTVDASLIESNLRRTGTGHLHRSSEFTHHFPFALENWVLVYGNRAYFRDLRSGGLLDDTSISPGTAWSVGDPAVTGREVRSFLTGAQFRFTEDKSKTSTGGGKYEKRQDAWDSRSSNLREIVQMLTWHDLAGGDGYTRLSNSALQELELSSHVDLGRAVLLAEASTPVSSLSINGGEAVAGSERTTTIVRVILPVDEAPIARSLPKLSD